MSTIATLQKAISLKEEEITKIIADINIVKTEINELNREYTNTEQQYSVQPNALTNVIFYGQTKNAFLNKMHALTAKLKEIQENLEQKEKLLLQKNIEKQKYVKYIERLAQKDLILQTRREQKAMDEMAQVMLRQKGSTWSDLND